MAYYVPKIYEALPTGEYVRAVSENGSLQCRFTSLQEMHGGDAGGAKARRFQISLAQRNGVTVVRGTYYLEAAKRIIPGAAILKVGKEDVLGRSSSEISMILGKAKPPGVELMVLNPGEEQVVSVKLPYGGPGEGRKPVLRTLAGKGGALVGYVRIPELTSKEDAAGLAGKIKGMLEKGVSGLVLDLRDCRRWSSLVAPDIAGLFVPTGTPLFITRDRLDTGGPESRTTVAKAAGTPVSLPVVILINEGTSSETEVTAAGLIDAGAAVAIGKRTFGDGLIYRLRRVPGIGGYLRHPVGEYLRAKGAPIFPTGIGPHKEIDAERAKLYFFSDDASQDAQLQAALAHLASEQRKQ